MDDDTKGRTIADREAAWDKLRDALRNAGRSPLESYVEANRQERERSR